MVRGGGETRREIVILVAMQFTAALMLAQPVSAETEATHSLQILVCPYEWSGATSPPPDTYEYMAGTTAVVTAVETSWDFLYWIVYCYDTGTWKEYKKATVKILMDDDYLAVAYFGYKGGDGGPDGKP